jgi:AAA+ ATPase superfamily predicted ATPase
MRFYNRETEIEILKRSRELSKKVGAFTVITGRRRVGKTALVRESEKESRLLYLYVTRHSEPILCDKLTKIAKEDLGIELYNTGWFHDLFRQIMEYGTKNSFTFFIDEFQELEKINRSITSSIQEYWDKYKSESKVNLIVCGSVHSMMIKIFQNYKEPLWGRATSQFKLGPFKPSIVKTILREHNPDFTPDDLLFLYMISGGIPKYIETLIDAGAVRFDDMLDAICTEDSIFINEGKNMLILEFGKDYGTYFSILKLIAEGKNTLREISDLVGKEAGSYLDRLENEYDLVKKNRPMFSKKNSRDIRWKISDCYLKFYFRFIESNSSLIEMKRFDFLKEKIRSEYAQYSGAVLEDYFREKLIEEADITNIGSYWDRKGQNEIDIIMLNDFNMKATVIEVKRDPNRADIRGLKEKAGSIADLKGFDVDCRILSLDDM